jgi:hypothetical protein
MVVLLWVWFFTYQVPNWVSIGIGFTTGMMAMAWAGDSASRNRSGSDKDPGSE